MLSYFGFDLLYIALRTERENLRRDSFLAALISSRWTQNLIIFSTRSGRNRKKMSQRRRCQPTLKIYKAPRIKRWKCREEGAGRNSKCSIHLNLTWMRDNFSRHEGRKDKKKWNFEPQNESRQTRRTSRKNCLASDGGEWKFLSQIHAEDGGWGWRRRERKKQTFNRLPRGNKQFKCRSRKKCNKNKKRMKEYGGRDEKKGRKTSRRRVMKGKILLPSAAKCVTGSVASLDSLSTVIDWQPDPGPDSNAISVINCILMK